MHLISRVARIIGHKSRAFASSATIAKVERLTSRSLIRISGTEVSTFLQGLITNDMRHLEEGSPAMFCVFLNTKGRVLYDSIIYRPLNEESDMFFVECDTDSLSALQRHLKLYRVRRKIDISDISNSMGVWAAYDAPSVESTNNDLIIVKDPRLKDLGYRIIAPVSSDVISDVQGTPGDNYQSLRYCLGVGEGAEELPPGNCFPLEVNCDYLHGVSFHKGCYIGQELTARTHHTGVVRKRLMPLNFEPCNELPDPSSTITTSDGKSVGKVRKLNPNGYGIALLRIEEVLKNPDNLLINNMTVRTHRPEWWPTEASKDRPPV